MSRVKKIANGHQWRYDGRWYNFCIKCGARYSQIWGISAKNCITLFDFKDTGNKHNVVPYEACAYSVICKKCNQVFPTAVGKLVFENTVAVFANDQIIVPYIEERKDRLIERFYCGYYNNKSSGACIIPCTYSDDEVIVRDIIL